MGSGSKTGGSGDKLRVLQVILGVNETNSQYNEHSLPLMDIQDISICTYFEPLLQPPDAITFFPGDGTITGFFRAFRRALRSGPYDVIHVHAPQSGALVITAMVLWLRLGRYRKSMVYTVHDSWYDYSTRNQMLMALALMFFKSVIFCSRAAYESMPRLCKWLVSGRWHIVQNAADIDRVDRVLETTQPIRDDHFTVLWVGRLEPVKDATTLLEAFERVAREDMRLVLVGTGSLEEETANEIRSLGLADRATMTGLIPRDEVFARFAGADVLVSTSHGEGLPVAIIEAMAAGCPVILSDIPPHRELVDGADFIPIVAKGDVEGFAREIERFYGMSSEERASMAARGREHVLERFALPIMHRGTADVYAQLPGLEGRTFERV